MKGRCGALGFWQGELFTHNGRLGQWFRLFQKTPLTLLFPFSFELPALSCGEAARARIIFLIAKIFLLCK
jgi:hypothetical protein